MAWLEPSLMLMAALFGMALVILGLPGVWLMVVCALLIQWWRPDTYSWWTLGVCLGLALLGEVLDIVASAVGARGAGGTKRSFVGAIAGGLIGAVLGTPIAPVVGTILGGAVGAGIGAAALDRSKPLHTWRMSARVGQGAAVGRLVSTLIKMVIGAVVGVALVVGAAV
ncbi:MAG: DUF456 domain-containing protein [Phycisphaerales bacterium]|nr:MAG: DUF456 domain-containing protein [Phycisphaerales bacterium]